MSTADAAGVWAFGRSALSIAADRGVALLRSALSITDASIARVIRVEYC